MAGPNIASEAGLVLPAAVPAAGRSTLGAGLLRQAGKAAQVACGADHCKTFMAPPSPSPCRALSSHPPRVRLEVGPGSFLARGALHACPPRVGLEVGAGWPRGRAGVDN